jgi:NAD(P)-dependent dehydrogenase (short-subunit alcohol dehydrogenase family)
VWTDGTRPALADAAFHKATLDKIPLGRIGEAHEVAGVVVFLASPAASLINGESILVDGGWCAQ